MTKEMTAKIDAIYQSRKSRKTSASGSIDSDGRFHIADKERCECCDQIRHTSRRFPYSSEALHARTRKHIANAVAAGKL